MTDDSAAGPGCLRTLFGVLVLATLGPLAAATRVWQRWRRGDGLRLEIDRDVLTDGADPRYAVADVVADVPHRLCQQTARHLTDAVVRVAEALSGPGTVMYLVARLPADPECAVTAIGPRPQDLGERFMLGITRSRFEGLTQAWLCLPGGVRLAEIVDPVSYDPGGPDEPDGLFLRASPAWAAGVAFARRGPSTVFRLRLLVPPSAIAGLDPILDRLGPALEARPRA